jgi:hypothetical protein
MKMAATVSSSHDEGGESAPTGSNTANGTLIVTT